MYSTHFLVPQTSCCQKVIWGRIHSIWSVTSDKRLSCLFGYPIWWVPVDQSASTPCWYLVVTQNRCCCLYRVLSAYCGRLHLETLESHIAKSMAGGQLNTYPAHQKTPISLLDCPVTFFRYFEKSGSTGGGGTPDFLHTPFKESDTLLWWCRGRCPCLFFRKSWKWFWLQVKQAGVTYFHMIHQMSTPTAL